MQPAITAEAANTLSPEATWAIMPARKIAGAVSSQSRRSWRIRNVRASALAIQMPATSPGKRNESGSGENGGEIDRSGEKRPRCGFLSKEAVCFRNGTLGSFLHAFSLWRRQLCLNSIPAREC